MKKMKRNLWLLAGLTLLFNCAPKQSDLTGDTFLTMSNGSIKPVAGKEIYLFPIETDFDASFVKPLQSFINAAKYNIAKSEVEKICMRSNKEIPDLIQSSSSELKDFLSGDQFIEGLNESCDALSQNIDNLEAKIASDQSSAVEQSQPITASIASKEAEAKKLREEIYRLALNQGNILKNEQIAKLRYAGSHDMDTRYSFIGDEVNSYSILSNQSDYIVLSYELGPLKWKGKSIHDDTPGNKKIRGYLEAGSYSWDRLDRTKKISAKGKTNSYGETTPGIQIGESQKDEIDNFRIFLSSLPTDRWLDENLQDIPLVTKVWLESNSCGDYSWDPCKSEEYRFIALGFREITEVAFGMPITTSTNPDTKTKKNTSKEVNWIEMGRKTDAYQSSPFHADLKVVEAEISELQNQIKTIKSELFIQDNSNKVAEFKNQLGNCNLAIDLRDTEIESQQCLNSLDSKDDLINLITNSESSLGADVQIVFNNITEDDLGYDNFEQLLNAFAQNRNAKVAVSSIDGKYSFNGVPNGDYVIFASYEDRFNGNGHWFEEITVESELKYDLNNLNYKKSGVYSYLRDKIEK
jgi:hypothetical protein